MTRRGRPRADHLRLVERVAALLLDDPAMSANAIQLETKARRRDVLRCVKIVRGVVQSDRGAATP